MDTRDDTSLLKAITTSSPDPADAKSPATAAETTIPQS